MFLCQYIKRGEWKATRRSAQFKSEAKAFTSTPTVNAEEDNYIHPLSQCQQVLLKPRELFMELKVLC